MKAQLIKEHYPIIIVGGGLVGASLAIALKQIGLQPLVVEAFTQDSEQQPSFDDRSVALSLSSLKIFENLGIASEILAKSEPIKNIHVSDQGHYGFTRLEADKMKFSKLGAVIENKIFGKILLEKIQEENLEYCCPATVSKVSLNQDTATIEIQHNDQVKTINSQLLILADGARSPLKNDLDFQSEIINFNANAIVCNVKTQLPHHNWAYERFSKNGPLAMLPLSDNRLSLVWSNTAEKTDELMKMAQETFARELEKTFGSRLGKIEQVGKRVQFPLLQAVTSNTVKEHCLLMGNSAQSLHPIAGQGLNLALRDIQGLQEDLKVTLQTNKEIGSYQCLRNFQAKRCADRNETIKATESLARIFSNDWAPLSISRNLIMKVLDLTPALKDSLALKAMGFKG